MNEQQILDRLTDVSAKIGQGVIAGCDGTSRDILGDQCTEYRLEGNDFAVLVYIDGRDRFAHAEVDSANDLDKARGFCEELETAWNRSFMA